MSKNIPQLLFANRDGKIYNSPHLEAAGMKGGHFFRLRPDELIKLPAGSELFMLPERLPVGYDPQADDFTPLKENPLSKKPQDCFGVSAFVSPGYTISYNSAYLEKKRASILPLFSYAAACFYRGEFYVTAVRVDRELRQDLRFMDINLVRKNAARLKKLFGGNRLIRHLERCALSYGCPAAKNLFLNRYEAPLPISPLCNARCVGCISYQPDKACSVTQPRIKFIPSPEEVAEVALFHMDNVKDPVVSFGQGCEGEPLLAGEVLENSIRLIRKKRQKGMINLNTNASKPEVIKRLFDAGLDSIRVSLNSAQELYYKKYYKPVGYDFYDVVESIKTAKRSNGFVSINYLSLPGFADSHQEFKAFKRFIRAYRIDMVQLRNLNMDPLLYFKVLRFRVDKDKLFGIKELILSLKREFPGLMRGYFNPSKSRIRRNR